MTTLDIAARAARITECMALGIAYTDETIDSWVRMTAFARNRPAKSARKAKPVRSRRGDAHPWAHDEE